MNRHLRLSLAWVLGTALLSGCGVLSGNKDMDYQSAAKRETPLEVPPDLVRPTRDERFALPASGVASRADFDRQQSGAPRQAAAAPVLPAVSGMRIERIGEQRALVVNQPAENSGLFFDSSGSMQGLQLLLRIPRPVCSRPTGPRTVPRFLRTSCARPWAGSLIASTTPASATNFACGWSACQMGNLRSR
jgi:Uncharacterized lipoprotein